MSEREEFLTWVRTTLRDAEIAIHNGDAGPRRAIWSRKWFRLRSRVPEVSLRPVEVMTVLGRSSSTGTAGAQRSALEIDGGQITAISFIANPDKLKQLGPSADLGALLRSAR